MMITKVEYRETMTFGNYQNATVGAVAEVNGGDSPADVFDELRVWVQRELKDQKKTQDDEEELRYQKGIKDDELNRLQRDIDDLKVKWHAARDFLEKHGVDVARYSDVPF